MLDVKSHANFYNKLKSKQFLLFIDGMDDEDAPSQNYINVKEGSLKNYIAPFEYMRVCYFANWAGNYQI
jgi:hypothetical protein